MSFFHYDGYLKPRARRLRNKSTLAEVILWNHIKQKKILGFSFLRQFPISNFIVDFYCKKLKLAIEVDGSSHDFKHEYDKERQRKLEALGITFIRFTNEQVLGDINSVKNHLVSTISHLKQTSHKSPL